MSYAPRGIVQIHGEGPAGAEETLNATRCRKCKWPVAIPSALKDRLCIPCRLRQGDKIPGHRLVEPETTPPE